MKRLHEAKAFICDMDGVIYHGNRLLPGVETFIRWIQDTKKEFVFLTNSSQRSQRELHDKLLRLGVDVNEKQFYTSALATADFLAKQKPNGSAYVIGQPGLMNALYDVGFTMNDVSPDYVIIGDALDYTLSKIEHAVELVNNGAKLIGTNSDVTCPTEKGIMPSTRALLAPIELATGAKPYYVGKPNPLMMRQAMKRLNNVDYHDVVIVGDRMDTDILAGVEAEMTTVLVLSGVTKKTDLRYFAYRPDYVLEGVADIVPK